MHDYLPKDVVLSVNGISKKFCRDLKRSLVYGLADIGQEMLGIRGNKNAHLRKKEFWALRDVTFQVKQGEALGLIGKNGSGKSTLLRIISSLVKPDVGHVAVKGRLAPLIALGAGFSPVLTGRENIYANMSILGLKKSEIDDRFDDVVKFSEIGDAIDSPVQTYSSGMAARLGFSSAIFTEPDILLIDEVLAVGDARFRARCYQKLAQLRSNGTTFILVSHSSPSIISVCERAIYLSQGMLIDDGKAVAVVDKYEQELFSQDNVEEENVLVRPKGDISPELFINSIKWKNSEERVISRPVTGHEVALEFEVESSNDISDLNLTLLIRDLRRGEVVLHFRSDQEGMIFSVGKGKYIVRIEMPIFSFVEGQYTMKITLNGPKNYIYDFIESYVFTVEKQPELFLVESRFFQERNWKVIPA